VTFNVHDPQEDFCHDEKSRKAHFGHLSIETFHLMGLGYRCSGFVASILVGFSQASLPIMLDCLHIYISEMYK
jgi:hypothetical protein